MGNLLRNALLALLTVGAVGCGVGSPEAGTGESISIKAEDLPSVAGCDSLTAKLSDAVLQRIEGVEDLYLVRDRRNQPRCIDSLAGAQRVIIVVPVNAMDRVSSNPMPGDDSSGDASSNPMPGVDPAASNPMPGSTGHK